MLGEEAGAAHSINGCGQTKLEGLSIRALEQGSFQCRGVQLIWIIVGQEPTVLVGGANGDCFDVYFFSPILPLFCLPFSGDSSIWTERLSQRAVKLKTTNQLTKNNRLNRVCFVEWTSVFRTYLPRRRDVELIWQPYSPRMLN